MQDLFLNSIFEKSLRTTNQQQQPAKTSEGAFNNEPKQRKNMFKSLPFILKIKNALESKKANDNLFKIYLDLDFQFYSVSFDKLQKVNFIYEENEVTDHR